MADTSRRKDNHLMLLSELTRQCSEEIDLSLTETLTNELLLLDREARISLILGISPEWPLFEAIRRGHTKIIEFFMDITCIDINEPIMYGKENESCSLLRLAVDYYQTAVVKLLFRLDAKLETLFDSKGRIYRLEIYVDPETKSKVIPVIEVLIESGLDVNFVDPYGRTFLMYFLHDPNMIRYLLRKGAKLDTKNHYGFTALHCAIQQGHVKASSLLIDKYNEIGWPDNIKERSIELCKYHDQYEIHNYLDKGFRSSNGVIPSFRYIGVADPMVSERFRNLHANQNGSPSSSSSSSQGRATTSTNQNRFFTPVYRPRTARKSTTLNRYIESNRTQSQSVSQNLTGSGPIRTARRSLSQNTTPTTGKNRESRCSRNSPIPSTSQSQNNTLTTNQNTNQTSRPRSSNSSQSISSITGRNFDNASQNQEADMESQWDFKNAALDTIKFLGADKLMDAPNASLLTDVRQIWMAGAKTFGDNTNTNSRSSSSTRIKHEPEDPELDDDDEDKDVVESLKIVTFHKSNYEPEFTTSQEVERLDEFGLIHQAHLIKRRKIGRNDFKPNTEWLDYFIDKKDYKSCLQLAIYFYRIRWREGSHSLRLEIIKKMISAILNLKQPDGDLNDVYLEYALRLIHDLTQDVQIARKSVEEPLSVGISLLLETIREFEGRDFIIEYVKNLPVIDNFSSNRSTIFHMLQEHIEFDGPSREQAIVLFNFFIDCGIPFDVADANNIAPLQMVFNWPVSNIKDCMIRKLFDKGAHIDRNISCPSGFDYKNCLTKAGINLNEHSTLRCLAARKLKSLRCRGLVTPNSLRYLLDLH